MNWSLSWSGDKKNITIKGFSFPPDAELVKCGLCKSIMLRDDFEDHIRYESTIMRVSVDAVEKLMGP